MTSDELDPALLDIDVTQIGDAIVLSVRGDLDLSTTSYFADAITSAVDESPSSALIIDLTEVQFLASAGMTVLVEASRQVGDSADFAVVADGPTTHRPLTLMGLDQVFSLHTDLDAALAASR